MSKKHVFLQFFSKIALFACVFCTFFISPVFANLPAGYTELEYIESTGTQYIDTGIKTNQDTEIQSKWSSDLNSSWVYGDGSSNPRMTLYASTEGNQRFGNVFVTINAFVSSGAIHTTTQNKTGLLFDGEMHQYTNVGTFTVANTLTIFHNIYSPVQPGLSGNMYFLQVYNGETLVRDFIPAKRNSDGEVGMYDTVSGTFFENAGTGDFIAGPIANCKTFGTDGVTCTECEPDYILNNDGGCSGQIKIATTKYVDDEFAPLNTALVNAISVVDNVVTQTIAQAAAIGELQNTKQTRPSDDNECPAGKKCLLVTDESGTPHWYPIVESILPDAYTQLEYIESTGTQYIDTGILPSEVDNIYIKFKNTDSDRGYLIGAAGGGKYNYIGIHNAFNGYGENWGGASNYMPFITPADTAVHTIEADLISVPKFYLDGELKATQTVYSTISSQYTLKINDAVYGSTNRCSAQYYSVTLSKNNAQIRNLIPAKRNSDSAIGMYDTVSGTFFTNSGTGSFVAGPTVF